MRSGFRLLTLTVIPVTRVITQQPLTEISKGMVNELQVRLNAFLVARRKTKNCYPLGGISVISISPF